MVSNDVGDTSGEIVTAVTMAGVPLNPPSLSAHAINHTAVQVNWTQPCKITASPQYTQACSTKQRSVSDNANFFSQDRKHKNKHI